MRSTDNLNIEPKHSTTSLSESPCLIIEYTILLETEFGNLFIHVFDYIFFE